MWNLKTRLIQDVKPDIMIHTCNLSIWEVEVGGLF